MAKVLSLREIKEIRREYQERPDETIDYFKELLESGQIKARDLSIRDLFVGLVEDGERLVQELDPRSTKRGISLLEASNAVDTSAFANINGQIVFSTTMEAYQLEADIVDQLMTNVPTRFNGERIPGIGGIGDEAESVDEGQFYPTAGLNEEYIETPQTVKVGLIIPVTKEAIFFDRTNVLLDRCSEVGTWGGLRKLKACLATVMGLTYQNVNYNTYRRNGVQSNTYLTSGSYVNSITSNPLVDWTNVQTGEVTLAQILDPNTAQPVVMEPTTLLVPISLKHTARRIMTATEVRSVYPGFATTGASAPVSVAAPGNVQTITGNPLDTYEVKSSRWIKFINGSATKWYFGAFRKAFRWMENFPANVIQAPSNSEAEFTQDIVQRYKFSYRGAPAVYNPRYVLQSDA